MSQHGDLEIDKKSITNMRATTNFIVLIVLGC